MLNAALYCVMRYVPIVEMTTGHVGWSLQLLVLFGLVSIIVAAAFIIFQHDVKRLLAYHSVEHIGIITLGFGLGGLGIFAALFHTLNHSICKTLSFFAAGRLGQTYGTHDMKKMSGSLRSAPVWGTGLFGSILVLIGVAPFAMFMSEFQVLKAAVDGRAILTLILFLAGGSVVFVGALGHAIAMAWGEPSPAAEPERAGIVEMFLAFAPLAILLVLGLWMPGTASEHSETGCLCTGGQLMTGTLVLAQLEMPRLFRLRDIPLVTDQGISRFCNRGGFRRLAHCLHSSGSRPDRPSDCTQCSHAMNPAHWHCFPRRWRIPTRR